MKSIWMTKSTSYGLIDNVKGIPNIAHEYELVHTYSTAEEDRKR